MKQLFGSCVKNAQERRAIPYAEALDGILHCGGLIGES
jgi:hypothetical protein